MLISPASLPSGARPQRSSVALATSMMARPPTSTTASVSSTGTETVTGAHRSSAVAMPSTMAFSPKTRQNSDTKASHSSCGRTRSGAPPALPVSLTDAFDYRLIRPTVPSM